MFTLDQITQTHRATVKTGADFPQFIQAIIPLGVARYETFVTDGHTVYYGNDGNQPQNAAKYAAMEIAANSDSEKFKSILQLHQQGKRDFMTFCKDCAETGVEKWVVDTAVLTCSYYDLAGNTMLVEKFRFRKNTALAVTQRTAMSESDCFISFGMTIENMISSVISNRHYERLTRRHQRR